jgi:glycosyltransferase involved in cell wall biosynthesis
VNLSRHHHGTHRDLLQELSVAPFPRDVDAIIVPTARKAAALEPAIGLAAKLNCTLVALCSKWSSARDVVALAEGRTKLIAIDIAELPDGVVPTFETCRVLEGTRFSRWTDLSLKRNFGLLLARLVGWERVVLLDDDIEVPEPMDLRDAAGLTDHYAAVGLSIAGMPDNSVVCHAYRAAGGRQDTFVGGGAMAVGVTSTASFFPNIYNEDWFFLLDDDRLRPTTTTGTAIQQPYDPFREQRARMEELGDVLAEGLFWLLDNERPLEDATTTSHWRTFLHERAGFITDVIGMVERMDGEPRQRERMLVALKAARGRCQYIKPELCVAYVGAWRRDRVRWRRHVEDVCGTVTKDVDGQARRSLAGVRAMLRSLGFHDRTAHLRLPSEPSHHDLAHFDLPFPVAVGQ